MKSEDNNVPVVSWCCGRVQSSNDVKQKNEKTQRRTNNRFRNPNKLIVWTLGSLWVKDLPKVNEIKVVFIHNIEQQSQMSTVYSFPSILV